MNQDERLFGEILKETTRLAREQGNYLTKEQIDSAFSAMGLQEGQLAEIYAYYRARHIGIDEKTDAEEGLSDSDRNYLALYLEELKALPVYSEEEKTALASRVLAGDTQAAANLMEAYLTLVPDIARLYAEQGVFLEDLIGEGNVALAHGVSLLDGLEDAEEVGVTLSRMIMNAMESHVAEAASIRMRDEKHVNEVQEIADRAAQLAAEYRRPLTVDEFLEETDFTREQIETALRLTSDAIEGIEGAAGEKQ